MTDPRTRHVRVEVDAVGYGSVQVDGVERRDEVTGVEIQAHAGQATEVTILLQPRPVVFDGQAIVVEDTRDVGASAAAFLKAIDPEILEQTALHRPDLGSGPGSTANAILRTLINWAEGRS